MRKSSSRQTYKQPHNQISKPVWTHWALSPWPSACEADVIPLHHVHLTETCRKHTHTFLSQFFHHRTPSAAAGFCARQAIHTQTLDTKGIRGQSPMDFESISLATQTQRHKDRGNTDQFAIIAPCLPGACNLEVNSPGAVHKSPL